MNKCQCGADEARDGERSKYKDGTCEVCAVLRRHLGDSASATVAEAIRLAIREAARPDVRSDFAPPLTNLVIPGKDDEDARTGYAAQMGTVEPDEATIEFTTRLARDRHLVVAIIPAVEMDALLGYGCVALHDDRARADYEQMRSAAQIRLLNARSFYLAALK